MLFYCLSSKAHYNLIKKNLECLFVKPFLFNSPFNDAMLIEMYCPKSKQRDICNRSWYPQWVIVPHKVCITDSFRKSEIKWWPLSWERILFFFPFQTCSLTHRSIWPIRAGSNLTHIIKHPKLVRNWFELVYICLSCLSSPSDEQWDGHWNVRLNECTVVCGREGVVFPPWLCWGGAFR